ncbi:MAG: acetyltransferase [Herbinix sp.]|jgi:acetyltransferase-like isoleucine patch superfamily enzyme|nr:acetyltransferase [Herbinix sp.]
MIALINYQGLRMLSQILNSVYSKIVIKAIKQVGRNAKFEYPVRMVGEEFIKIGDCFIAYRNLRIEVYKVKHICGRKNPLIEIGNNVNIQPNCHIGCINHIKIGNGVVIASNVSILDHFHGNIDTNELDITPAKRQLVSKGEIIIGDNVWLGENVVILPNVRIGKGAIIGAGAVVTKDIPEYSVAGGIPARVIKQLRQKELRL